jgi:hypothetical protein
MRRQICKHLSNRSQAIRGAVNAYNKAAKSLSPPHSTITYTNILDLMFVSQFDLLRYSRPGDDIRKKPWADTATRILTDKYFEYCRAKEELQRLNIEWRRVRTWLSDEKDLYLSTIEALREAGELTLSEIVKQSWTELKKAHRVIWDWLRRTQQLSGFTGNISRGNACRPLRSSSNMLSEANPTEHDVVHDEESGESSDELDDSATGGFFSGRVDDPETLGNVIDAVGAMSV